MTKKEFLKALETELIKLGANDITNILEYYDELIEDKKESGKKEKDIVNELSIYDIVKEVKVHKRVDEAVKSPTISNGMKALIAFLGFLSVPMLIGVGGVIFGIVVTIAALLFALFVTSGAIIIASVTSIFVLIAAIILGKLPFVTALFCIGIVLVFSGLFGLLLKWSITLSKETVAWLSGQLQKQLNKRKGGQE